MFATNRNGLSLAFCAAVVFALATSAHAEELDLRVHMQWGQGEARQWSGTASLDHGSIVEVVNLPFAGATSSAAGKNAQVEIKQSRPLKIDGVHARLVCPAAAKLTVDLTPLDEADAVYRVVVPVRDLLRQAQAAELDDKGNRLRIARAPGDALRMQFGRPHLVFAPGERLSFRVLPHLVAAPSRQPMGLRCSLIDKSTGQSVWTFDEVLTRDQRGRIQPTGVLTNVIPPEGGVYDLELALSPLSTQVEQVTGQGNLLPPVARRRVQLAVVAPREQAPVSASDDDSATWRTLVEVRGGSGGHDFSRPLVVNTLRPGTPHVVEFRLPADQPQQLPLSITEPLRGGGSRELLRSTLLVSPRDSAGRDEGTQRVIVWPTAPRFQIALRSGGTPQVIHAKVVAGPPRLPNRNAVRSFQTRQAAWRLDDPRLLRQIAPPSQAERRTSDWRTFQAGCTRLLDYVQHTGYNTLVVRIADSGGTLYPSRLLAGGGAYDDGMLQSRGEDPMQKDVVELLARMCDIRGVTFIPSVCLPAPADLNPLDPAYQQSVQTLVAEVAGRYSQHVSFAGVELCLGDNPAFVIPTADAVDEPTYQRFLADRNETLAPRLQDASLTLAQRNTIIRQSWYSWQDEQMTRFARELANTVRQRRADARLILHGGDAVAAFARSHDAGRLEDLGVDILLARCARPAGCDPQALGAIEGLALLTPAVAQPAHVQQIDVTAALASQHYAAMAASNGNRSSVGGCAVASDPLIPLANGSPFVKRQRLMENLLAGDQALYVDDAARGLPAGDPAFGRTLRTFTRLPDQPFADLRPQHGNLASQPVRVRAVSAGQQTFIYAVNASPSPCLVTLPLQGAADVKLSSLGGGKSSTVAADAGPQWRVELEPYSLAAVVADSATLQALPWRAEFARLARNELKANLDAVAARIDSLQTTAQRVPLNNGGFEAADERSQPVAWRFAQGAGIVVDSDTASSRSGNRSLHLVSEAHVSWAGPLVWAESEPLDIPDSGRAALRVWARTSDGRQPAVRVTLQSTATGEGNLPKFVRRIELGSTTEGDGRALLSDGWRAYDLFAQGIPADAGQLQVRLELVGSGEVWFDDVVVRNLWMTPREQQLRHGQLAAAREDLAHGHVSPALALLDSHWAQYLTVHVPTPTQRAIPRPEEFVSPTAQPQPTQIVHRRPQAERVWPQPRPRQPRQVAAAPTPIQPPQPQPVQHPLPPQQQPLSTPQSPAVATTNLPPPVGDITPITATEAGVPEQPVLQTTESAPQVVYGGLLGRFYNRRRAVTEPQQPVEEPAQQLTQPLPSTQPARTAAVRTRPMPSQTNRRTQSGTGRSMVDHLRRHTR